MIGILGGTFDPVHFAHLRCALEIREALDLTELRFVPCRQPPHRGAPRASAAQRRAMLALAVDGQEGFRIDERELGRPGPSYMVDTLASLRAEHPRESLCLLVGLDAFVELPTWHRWERLIELAHLVVMERPMTPPRLPPEIAALCSRSLTTDPAALRDAPAGRIIRWPVTQLDISATRIRGLITAGASARYLLPDAVLAYIQREGLYRDERT